MATTGGPQPSKKPPKRCHVKVALVAPNGSTQPVQMVIQMGEIMFESPEGKVLQRLPLPRIVKWLKASHRTKSPGPAYCLDLHIQFADGMRELRLRCNSERTVEDIMVAMQEQAKWAADKELDATAASPAPPPATTQATPASAAGEERSAGGNGSVAPLPAAGPSAPTVEEEEELALRIGSEPEANAEPAAEHETAAEEAAAAVVAAAAAAGPLLVVEPEAGTAAVFAVEGRAAAAERAAASERARAEELVLRLQETTARLVAAESSARAAQTEAERGAQFATRMRDALRQRDETVIHLRRRMEEEVQRRRQAEYLLRTYQEEALLRGAASESPAMATVYPPTHYPPAGTSRPVATQQLYSSPIFELGAQ